MADNDGQQPFQPSEAQEEASTAGTSTRRTSASSTSLINAARDRSVPTRQTGTLSDSQQLTQSPVQRAQHRPQRLDYGSIRQDSNRPQLLSPQIPKRPTTLKRNTSTVAPHRGQEFSVDDDPSEVDLDLRLARQHSRQESHRDRTIRRQQSTLRRRPTAQMPSLPTLDSEESAENARVSGHDVVSPIQAPDVGDPSSEETLQEEEEETPSPDDDDDDDDDDDGDDADISDSESFTLKDRQEAINETHPFGIRIWKPALYKKNRSVQRNAEGDIHSAPGGNVSRWLFIFNCLWTLIFGWWLCLIAGFGGFISMFLSIFQLPGCYDYGRVMVNLAHYLFYPFGKYVKLEHDEAYLDEDEGEGRSISEYERWQTGDLEEGRLFFGPTGISRSLIGRRRDDIEDLDEHDSLLGRQRRQSSNGPQRTPTKIKKRLFGRGKWSVGRVIFFLTFYCLISPCLFLVSGICWFLVFSVPMAKVTLLLFYHLRRHPLALSFHDYSHYSRTQSIERGSSGSSILLCTYRAVGPTYWKYTIDGTNILLINLLGLVVFVIFDYFILFETLGITTWITNLGLVFVLALFSIIPLAYFIGQAVASISAQSSMGVGATINAFFSTVVEVFLYCVALKEGKSSLVEGSIIGSIFAGILFLPGLSMCFGALKRKTQRFNVRSAGVTSTMLLFAVIGAFCPTMFYQIFGGHELNCYQCYNSENLLIQSDGTKQDCRRCYFNQAPELRDRFYIEAVRPYVWFATVCLFLSYVVGLMFTLRTHAAVIWNNEPEEKKEGKTEQMTHRLDTDGRNSLTHSLTLGENPLAHAQRHGSYAAVKDNIRDSQMYKRILSQSLKQVGINQSASVQAGDGSSTKQADSESQPLSPQAAGTPHVVPPKTPDADRISRIQGLSPEDNRALVQEIAEMAATAATVAARDATKMPRRTSVMAMTSAINKDPRHRSTTSSVDHKQPKDGGPLQRASTTEPGSLGDHSLHPEPATQAVAPAPEQASGSHDAPNWSRTKSAVILLTATVAYAIIAEILVNTVDAVLSNIDIDEKFLGITLFALVPNTTEFLNAISFAMNGNVALSMEIGSSYALQVMLLQIPCLVVFSAVYGQYINVEDLAPYSFTLIFPQWDTVTVILSVFLMGWVFGEGKSNYFKGSILIFSYLVIVVGFWFSGYSSADAIGVDRYDTLALGSSPRIQTIRTGGRGARGRAY